MNISGKIKIKAKVNEMTGKIDYQTVVSSKDKDGETTWWWVSVNFVKDASNAIIDNDTYINVLDGFFTFYKRRSTKDVFVAGEKTDEQAIVEECVPKFVVSKYELAETKESEIDNTFANNIDDNDLPF